MVSTHTVSVIHSQTQAAAAMAKVVETVKALNLTQEDFKSLVQIDILGKFATHLDPVLTAFTMGMQSAWHSAIIQDHCEFIYTSPSGQRYGSVYDKNYPHAHFSYMPPSIMADSTAAFYWKGTDAAFTPSVNVGDLS